MATVKKKVASKVIVNGDDVNFRYDAEVDGVSEFKKVAGDAKLEFTIEGISPMVQHNGQLADPLNTYAKRVKSHSAKRNKTDDDHMQLARIEWEGALYLDDLRRVCLPREVLKGAYAEAAAKIKRKPSLREGVWFQDEYYLLDFEHAHLPIEELWDVPGPKGTKIEWLYRCRSRVGVNKKTIVRTRPIFAPGWRLTYELTYNRSIFNPRELLQITEILGAIVGVSDDRKLMGGRFRVVSCEGRLDEA